MKQTKILRMLTTKEANAYEGEVASLLYQADNGDDCVTLWVAEKNSLIADCCIVQDCGYYIVITTQSMKIVNEFYYETLVDACKAFNEVADMVKK